MVNLKKKAEGRCIRYYIVVGGRRGQLSGALSRVGA